MMMVLFTPISDEVNQVQYSFNGDVVNVTLNGEEDSFDFSALPDGVAEKIETTLPMNPFINAERVNGVLFLEVRNFITSNSTEFEKFPNWIEVV